MCRLFGLHAGRSVVSARFWLLDAPDSLEEQSRRNHDGTGIGFFTESGRPVLDKQPEAAYADEEFVHEAKTATSRTFVSHVRFATTGQRTATNTHPFAMDGRIMAHNGGFGELDAIEAEIGTYRDLVLGDTDSERYFALVTARIDQHDGDIGAGIASAAAWIAENLPLFSLNLVLATPDGLWALRYPDHHRLWVLERQAGGHRGDQALHATSDLLHVHSPHLSEHPSVVVASEPMDENPRWRELASGELLHVGPDLSATTSVALTGPPKRFVLPDLPPAAPTGEA